MPGPSPMEVDDAIVLLLGAPALADRNPGTIRGITRLEKLVFLLERETSAKDWLTEEADFKAYNFGPFASKVYQAVDKLSAANIITDSSKPATTVDDTWEENNIIGELSAANDLYATRDFSLTERGKRYYEALVRELGPNAVDELSIFKSKFANVPLRQLIRYVYLRYPAFTTKSVIRRDILGPDS